MRTELVKIILFLNLLILQEMLHGIKEKTGFEVSFFMIKCMPDFTVMDLKYIFNGMPVQKTIP
jgi:hypothetical protein